MKRALHIARDILCGVLVACFFGLCCLAYLILIIAICSPA